MKNFPPAPVICLCIIACLFSAGCTGSLSGPAPVTNTLAEIPVPPAGTSLTLKEIIPYVDAAAAYARAVGKEEAIARFNDPGSVFNRGGAYIFSGDMDGMVLADPFGYEMVGMNNFDREDRYGIPFVQNLADTARSGKGLVRYQYQNPAHDNAIEPRVSYVVNVDGTYYIGAGYYESYGTAFPDKGRADDMPALTKDELVTFVTEARDYARVHGREAALAAFNNPSGPFIRQELYIIAYDVGEQNLAHPYQPLIRDLDLTHYTDEDSVATISELSAIAQRGGGFAHITQQIPVDGKRIFAPKLQYVLPVDDTWWISAGILNPDYARLRTGNMTGIQHRARTQAELQALVGRAVNYARENGKEKTLVEITRPDGIFNDGNLVVWASGFDGTLLADPILHDLVGKDQMNFTDAYGEKTTVVGIHALRNGTGYVHGMFADPLSGSERPVPKLMYLKAVDDTWWIGSGIYGVDVR
jgi:polar amino acid transport system substrate-binding protein